MDSDAQKEPALDLPPPATTQDAQTAIAPVLASPLQPAAVASVPVAEAGLMSAQKTQDDSKSDELDQAWAQKTKAVVEQTKHDPFLESVELSKLKAEYLKIRYNKQIGGGEEQA